MKFCIMSHTELTSGIQPCLPIALIIIDNPDDPPAEQPKWDKLVVCYRTCFYDLTPRVFRRVSGEKYIDKLISNEQADELIRFAIQSSIIDKVEMIIVSCTGGISRSPAVAAALSVVLDGPGMDMWVWESKTTLEDCQTHTKYEACRWQPNLYVYAKLIKRWRVWRL